MIKNIFWNSGEHRLRAIWRQIIQLILFSVLLLVIANGVKVLLGPLRPHSSGLHINAAGEYLLDLPLTELLSAVSALLSIWIMARFINREPFAVFGFRFNRDWWLDCGFGLLLGLVLTAAVFLVELAAGWVTITGTFYSGVAGVPFGLALLGPFILFVSAALYEEPYFRAYPIRNLSQGLKKRGPTLATGMVLIWVLTSIIFGWSHAGNPGATPLGLINIGLAGILFGLSYMLTGSLGLSIGIHIAWDFCQGCVFGTAVAGTTPGKAVSFITLIQHGPALFTGGAFGTDGGLLVTLAFLLGMIPVFLYVRWRYGKASLYTEMAQYSPRAKAIASDTLAHAQQETMAPEY
ncbi:MAG: CPBP family intramembrane metalloprotease [Ktedonobacteraceae bacterium]|nr:CPBP family intramembrane metalloprotease [Ktedonobacteraceae bacterium]